MIREDPVIWTAFLWTPHGTHIIETGYYDPIQHVYLLRTARGETRRVDALFWRKVATPQTDIHVCQGCGCWQEGTCLPNCRLAPGADTCTACLVAPIHIQEAQTA